MNIVRIVDMTGCVSMLMLILISIIYLKRKSKLLHKLHGPLTIVCSIALLIHLVTSFTIGSMQNLGFAIVIITGVLATVGFIVSVLVIIRKKNRTKNRLKLHIVLALMTFAVTVIHIMLSEMLL